MIRPLSSLGLAASLLLCLFTASCLTDEAARSNPAPITWEEPPPSFAPAAPAPPTVAMGDVQTTASGLQYEVIEVGTGAVPGPTSQVRVHYHGYLPSGMVFDSSVQRGSPATFPLNRVIPGWTEGLQLMREGAKYRFTIPSNLAYGTQGSPPLIGPNQPLMFDVELIQVVSP